MKYKMKNKIWILGPCALESREMFLDSLRTIDSIMDPDDEWYMKASFDKANRTSLHGGRGCGMAYAQDVWRQAKDEYPGVKLITDIHETHQIEHLVGLIDVVQIPAFLSRQTDLIVESARHFNKINIKKGQWLGPNNLIKSVDKIKETNSECEAWICDRGSNFGYHDLFVNFGIVDELKQHYDRVILDCTHATQRSRSVYGTQGDRELAKRYFLAADIFNYDGVFAEVHPDPNNAISDGDCQIVLSDLELLVTRAKKIANQ
jgi:2-dehydro-3-deoxyphosphooctonate aldolase (KDO 8-P synthase)